MAKEYSKQQKLDNVERKEKYVELIKNKITAIENRLEVAHNSYDNNAIADYEIELFEYKERLKINVEIAEDFRAEYRDIFLAQYEKRLEDCAKNFDDCYKLTKENLFKIPKTNPLYVSIVGYPQENPDNEDEDKMLLFYEAIKPFAEAIKRGGTVKIK